MPYNLFSIRPEEQDWIATLGDRTGRGNSAGAALLMLYAVIDCDGWPPIPPGSDPVPDSAPVNAAPK